MVPAEELGAVSTEIAPYIAIALVLLVVWLLILAAKMPLAAEILSLTRATLCRFTWGISRRFGHAQTLDARGAGCGRARCLSLGLKEAAIVCAGVLGAHLGPV